jgi:hypothetical protein
VLAAGVVFVVLSRSGGASEETAVSLQLSRGGAIAARTWRF